ncbi:MAG: NfeD family protein [Alicyclobacillus sp.]|nr:NfeD family protein [Alicyclobacillus sp.]
MKVAWWIWLIVALVLGLVEVATITFVLMWIAAGALVTTIVAALTPNIWPQLAVFVVVSGALLWFTRPLARKFRGRKTYPTNRLETMLHKTGVVIEAAKAGKFATVRIDGELWSAESDADLEAGQKVTVVAANTTVLKVEPSAPREEGGVRA